MPDRIGQATYLRAGGDACVPRQTKVRPGDRTSLGAGGMPA
ncbi:MAG: hypothetical protein ACI4UO_05015 [Paludibacteraceae bacterium]